MAARLIKKRWWTCPYLLSYPVLSLSQHRQRQEVRQKRLTTTPRLQVLVLGQSAGASPVNRLCACTGGEAGPSAQWYHAGFHNVCAVVGVGVLGLPYAFSYLGWFGGIFGLTATLVVSLYTAYQISALHEEPDGTRHNRYADLGRAILGQHRCYALSCAYHHHDKKLYEALLAMHGAVRIIMGRGHSLCQRRAKRSTTTSCCNCLHALMRCKERWHALHMCPLPEMLKKQCLTLHRVLQTQFNPGSVSNGEYMAQPLLAF